MRLLGARLAPQVPLLGGSRHSRAVCWGLQPAHGLGGVHGPAGRQHRKGTSQTLALWI